MTKILLYQQHLPSGSWTDQSEAWIEKLSCDVTTPPHNAINWLSSALYALLLIASAPGLRQTMKCLALSVNQSHSQRKLVHHRGYPYRLFVPDSLEIILGKTFFCTPSCQTVELLTRSHCTLNRFKRSLHKVDLSGFITIQ